MVVRISVAGNGDSQATAARLLEDHPSVEKVDPAETELRVTLKTGDHDHSELAKLLIDNGLGLMRLTEEEINLETAFMALTKGITS